MKKLLPVLLLIICLQATATTTSFQNAPLLPNASQIMITIGKTGQKISLLEFSKLSAREYEKLADTKLGFFNRITYKKAMKKVRKGIAADGTITDKKIARLATGATGETGFNGEGFGLGFLLAFVGILIAYLAFKDADKKNRIKWAWIGTASMVFLLLILVVIILE